MASHQRKRKGKEKDSDLDVGVLKQQVTLLSIFLLCEKNMTGSVLLKLLLVKLSHEAGEKYLN